MDALKFAFEILIVGVLALPWLALFIQAVSPPNLQIPKNLNDYLGPFLSFIPKGALDTVGLVLMVAVGYLLGSAISRISRNLFNDEVFPLEEKIRTQVYYNEYCQADVMNDRYLPYQIHQPLQHSNEICSSAKDKGLDTPLPPLLPKVRIKSEAPEKELTFAELAREMFRLQEGQLLLSGGDKVERLKGLYDQLEVLRGSAVNGFILLALCGFGYFGSFRAKSSTRRLGRFLALLPAYLLIFGGFIGIIHHWISEEATSRYSDPPLVELVICLLGLIGFWVTLKVTADTWSLQLYIGAVAGVLTILSFGGWWWTEVMYDLHVIHAIPGLREPTSSNLKETVITPVTAAEQP